MSTDLQQTSFMRLHGARLADAGFFIIPVTAGRKFPGSYAYGRWTGMEDWTRFAHTKAPDQLIEMWSNWPGCSIGIATGGASGVIGIDIDVLDGSLVTKLKQVFFDRLGFTPLQRVGRVPKVMLLYRVSQPMQKIVLHPIEVLATGNQFVAYGVHPDTQQPYTWPVESPDDTPVENLPLVTPEQVRAAAEEAYALIPMELRPKPLAVADTGPRVSSGQTALATPEAIQWALDAIPNPDVPWDDWSKICMATWASCGGQQYGFDAFMSWSAKSKKHDPAATAAKWQGCFRSPPKRLGFGTLHFLATQAGAIAPAGLAFNVEKAGSTENIAGLDMPEEPLVANATTFQSPVLPQIGEAGSNGPNSMYSGMQESYTTMNTSPQATAHAQTNLADGHSGGSLTHRDDLYHPTNLCQNSFGLLTGMEAKHLSIPAEFAESFPYEWLFTNSVVGRIAQWIDAACIKNHRIFSLMAALTAFGSIVGRQYISPTGIRPNLACCIIAGTGSGKEGPRSAVTTLFHAAGAERFIGPRGGFSSGSGVVEGLKNQPSMWLSIDEMGKKIGGYGRNADQNQREMIAMFLEALANNFLGGKGYANSAEHAIRNVVYPNLNIYSASQLEELTNAFSSSAANDGLLQRFLFVPTFAEYVTIKRGFTVPSIPEDLIECIRWLIEHLQVQGGEFASNDDPTLIPNMITVNFTPDASDFLETLDERLVELAKAKRTMWVRSGANAAKVAMLEAIAIDPLNPVVTLELLESASRLVNWFTSYAENVIRPAIADTDHERRVNHILAIIRQAGPTGILRNELTRKTQKYNNRDREDILRQLKEDGRVVDLPIDTNSPGPKAVRYRANLS